MGYKQDFKMEEEIINLERLKFIDAASLSTENIFHDVELKTGAHVQWENGCRIAPYRKEPSIKLTGTADSVKLAKEMLLDRMEVQSNRVIMKMDITHFEHPSLIGKSGKLIKKVMDTCSCHIHFPDGNKFPEYEKSNQVSITGQPENVEKARLMLRALIPIQIFFEVPATSHFQKVLDPCSPETRNIEKEYGLLLYTFKGNNGLVCVIRCNQDKFLGLRKEIPLLIETICCRKGVDLPSVHIITDIMPQNQIFVKGNNNCNLEDIKKKTGADITFPNISVSRAMRNAVIISGNLDSVYIAWQDLMSYLPITVSFDVNDSRETRGEYLNFLHDCGVMAFNHPKPKYHVKSVTLRGPEKFSKQMLQYRQHLLRLHSLSFSSDHEQANLATKLISSTTEYLRSTYSAIPQSIVGLISGKQPTTHGETQDFPMGTSVYSDRTFQKNRDLSYLNEERCDYQKLKVMAAKAMRRPIDSLESAQVPSSLWAGYGFSQSMPAAVIKEKLYGINHFSCSPFDNGSKTSSEDSDSWENVVLKDCMPTESIWSNNKDSLFSHSNYFDFLRGTSFTSKSSLTEGILSELLWQHNLQHYSDIFIKEEVDYDTFLLLSDEDLVSLGIPFHARVKMMCLIKDLKEKTLKRPDLLSKSFNAAPGAEREERSFSEQTRGNAELWSSTTTKF